MFLPHAVAGVEDDGWKDDEEEEFGVKGDFLLDVGEARPVIVVESYEGVAEHLVLVADVQPEDVRRPVQDCAQVGRHHVGLSSHVTIIITVTITIVVAVTVIVTVTFTVTVNVTVTVTVTVSVTVSRQRVPCCSNLLEAQAFLYRAFKACLVSKATVITKLGSDLA